MKNLSVNIIPIGDYLLERVQPNNMDHYRAIKRLRDHQAKKNAFDLKYQLDSMKQDNMVGNNYLITDIKNYLGFIYISPVDDGERELSIIVNRKLRNKGLGTIIIDGISEFLFDGEYADIISMNIRRDNKASIRMANKCGFLKEMETEQMVCFKKVRNI